MLVEATIEVLHVLHELVQLKSEAYTSNPTGISATIEQFEAVLRKLATSGMLPFTHNAA